ncbi:hypothetical protein LZ198_28820 [Myxococcus sp. K15C18031901]|uniref:MATE family efflux transporter n=1 Tax=Myxococcus dinghuensis TaxID=2906761 RepID=UPI0020A74B0E|nr:MATE family efflux transporter [Myxococcus dinghuensis]MCP3102887.1 hypothetical protein [Myxococcus dinghuensis]
MTTSAPVEAGAAPAGTLSSVIRDLSVLALKTVATQVVPVFASLYVASIVAKESALSFSSFSLVNAINLTIFLGVSGCLQALYFVAGRALGRKEPGMYAAAIVAGLALSFVFGAVMTGLSIAIGPILGLLRLDADVAALAGPLGVTAALGILPSVWMVVYRVHASLREKAGLVTIIYVLGALAIVVLAMTTQSLWPDRPGRAALGVLGSVAAANWLMLLLARVSWRALPDLRFTPEVLAEAQVKWRIALGIVVAVGWPIGVVILLECLAPLVSSLLIGRYWVSAMPVHSVVLLCVSLGQVIPIGLGQAAVQRVAVLHSAGDALNRNRVAVTSLVVGAVLGGAVVALFAAASASLGALFLGPAAFEPGTRLLLEQLMLPGGLLLAIQGIIFIGAAILRGVGQTRAPLVQCLIGYCVIASGGQVLLGPVLGLGVQGVWWGLILGFGATALAVVWRCFTELRSDNPKVQPT